MKLFTSGASPFVRKVLVAAHEIGLADRITQAPTKMSPVEPNEDLCAHNPLGKIPALELDDGTTLYDSRVIVEYLDMLHDGPRLIPQGGPARWAALRMQALADGLLDAGILVRYELLLRPENQRSAEWTNGQCKKVLDGLGALQAEVKPSDQPPNIGEIAAACAVGWLEFRKPLETRPAGAIDVRAAFSPLYAWFDALKARPSFVATAPRA